MGTDVFGVEPLTKEGEYFRANIFSWGPIVALLSNTCSKILSEEDFKGIQFNMGYEITADKSVAIANRLAVYLEHHTEGVQLDEGGNLYTDTILEKLNQTLDELEDSENTVVYVGNGGKNLVKDEHLSEFADFCRQSGGFQVW